MPPPTVVLIILWCIFSLRMEAFGFLGLGSLESVASFFWRSHPLGYFVSMCI